MFRATEIEASPVVRNKALPIDSKQLTTNESVCSLLRHFFSFLDMVTGRPSIFSHAVEMGSASVLARRLRRLAEGIRKGASIINGRLAFVLRQSAGRRMEATGTVRAPLFQRHGYSFEG